MRNIDITIIQSDLFWENKEANLSNFESKIHNLTNKQDLIVLPEMFNTAFSMKPELFSEKPLSTTHQWMEKMSKMSNSYVAGSYMVVDGDKYFNRFIIMSPDGSYQKYDKRHLFRMGNEHNHFEAGQDSLIFEINGWKIKALICYDLRFPVFAKNNYSNGEYEYDALIYVANWPKVRNHIWEVLLRARALENQAAVIGVNRVGVDGNGLDHAGSSCIIDAKGDFVIPPQLDNEFIATASLNFNELSDFRSKFTVGLDWDIFKIEK
ncbi:MAG: nitrilase family protein [Bacteroidales bacterium]|nr:nitrilase family protein [Bacteroidales bacterium]